MDLIMQGEDALKTWREGKPSRPEAAVVFMTRYSRLESEARAEASKNYRPGGVRI